MHQPLRSVFDLLLQRRHLLFLALAPLCAVLLMFALLSGSAAMASPADAPMRAPLVSGPGVVVYTKPMPDDPDSNIWIMNIDGSHQTQLTTYAGVDRLAMLSPDGTKIAYSSYQSNQQLWVMNTDGTGKVQVPLSGHTEMKSWSPDGSKLALTHDDFDGNWWEVWVVNADGSDLHRLTLHASATGSPSWSPDGQKLVYVVEEPFPQYHNLYVINSDGTGNVLLVSASGTGYSNHMPAWSPDGVQIATVRHPAGNSSTSDLWLMDANGSNGHTLVSNIEAPNYNRIAWTTDSNWLLFAKDGNIWRVRRDGTELAQITTDGGYEPSYGPGLLGSSCSPALNAADIMLLVDRSGSMANDNKLVDAKAAISDFLVDVDAPPDQVGLASFATTATLDHELTTNKAIVDSAAQALTATGNTYINLGLEQARLELGSSRHVITHTKVIILLSDGGQSDGDTAAVLAQADAAKLEGAKIYAIGLGADADAVLLQQIATSVDHYYFAPNGSDLQNIYDEISADLACPNIGGQVFVDEDEDGVYDTGVDTPLSGVTVQLAGALVSQTVSTNAVNGNYLFTLNPAGHYTVTIDMSTVPGIYEATTPVSTVLDLASGHSLGNDFGFSQTPIGKDISYTRPEPDTGVETNIWVMNFDGSGQTQLTTYNLDDRFSAMSPDGSKIAYQSMANGKWTLWVMNVDGTGKTQLPILLNGNPNGVIWSSDGSKLAFGSEAEDWWEIWVADANGANVQRLTTHAPAAGHPAWSPDGQKLVYGVNPSTAYLDLYTVNSNGAGQTLLVSSSATGYSNHMPAWSPDGTQIAAVHWPAGTWSNFSLWVVDADGTNGQVLVPNIDHPHINNIAWSSDSSWLYFGKEGNIWRVQRNGTQLTQITFNGGWEPSIRSDGFGSSCSASLNAADRILRVDQSGNIYDQTSADLACPNIGGEVFVDQNQDGQYTLGVDTPLAGVTVRLSGALVSQTVSISATPVNYLFPLNPAGTYTVSVDLTTLPEYHQATTPTVYTFTLGVDDDLNNHFGFKHAPPPDAFIAPIHARTPTPPAVTSGG